MVLGGTDEAGPMKDNEEDHALKLLPDTRTHASWFNQTEKADDPTAVGDHHGFLRYKVTIPASAEP